MKNTSQESLADSFHKALTAINEGASNKDALKAQFEKKIYEVSGKPLDNQKKKPIKSKPASQMNKTHKAKPKAKRRAKPVKVESFVDTIENRIEAQRKARKGGKVRLFAKKVKSDIADKVAKQRKERETKPKNKTIKDPKKTKSRPFRLG